MAGTGLPIPQRRPTLLEPPPMAAQPTGGSAALGQAMDRLGATGARLSDEIEHAERTRYVADLTLTARARRIELAAQNPDNPEGFNAGMAGFRDGVLAGVDLRYADHARRVIEGERLAALDGIYAQAAAKSKALAADSIKALTMAAEDDILSSAYRGGVADPAFDAAFRRAEAAQYDGVKAGLWSEDSARLRLDQMRGRAQGEAVVGALRRTYEAGGRDAALADLEAFRRGDNIQLDPVERERIANRGESSIRLWEADKSASLTEVRATATELKKNADVGKADEKAVIDAAARLDALGDHRGASALRRAYGRQEFMANAMLMPVPEHERLLQGMHASPGRPLVDRIIGVESGGNPNAKNENSTATGLGQFIKSTWLDVVRRNAPEIAAGKTEEQILALRTDAGLSRRMTAALAEENRDALAAAGLPHDDGAVYLAHFAGVSGAKGLLRAAPSTPVEQILSAEVIAANGFLRGKPGDMVGWAAGKMAGGGPDPELIRDLEAGLARKREALKNDPLGYAMQLRGAPTLPAIDWSNPPAATAALQQRQDFARKTAALFQIGVATPLTRAEIDGLKGRYDDADANGKVKILGTLARSLDGAHLGKTLEKLAPDRPVLALAGALYARSPNIAESIVMGDAALKINPKSAPPDDKAFREKVDEHLGTALGAPFLAQVKLGVIEAARARYVSLRGSPTDIDSALLNRALDDVTGGAVTWEPSAWGLKGAKIIPPRPGMTATEFEKLMNELKDADLADARTAGGASITADSARRLAMLEDAAPGRYRLLIGGRYVMTLSGSPFVLDLSGREPAPEITTRQAEPTPEAYATGGAAARWNPAKDRSVNSPGGR